MVFGQSLQKMYQFLSAQTMNVKTIEMVAMSPDPGGTTLLRQGKMLVPNGFRKPEYRCVVTHPANALLEQLFVY
jgi:hypothetical protein